MLNVVHSKSYVIIILLALCALAVFLNDGPLTTTARDNLEQGVALLKIESVPAEHNGNNTIVESPFPPLILLSAPCSGSTFVIQFAQQLVKRHLGLSAYDPAYLPRFKNEYLAAAKGRVRNPRYNISLAKTSRFIAGRQMVHETYQSIPQNSSLAMITKLLKRHIDFPGVAVGLQELNSRFVMVYRQNLLESEVCGAKDGFAERHGHVAVFENGTQSELSFQRRNFPWIRVLARFNIHNFSQSMETIMDKWGCSEALKNPELKTLFDSATDDKLGNINKYPRLMLERLLAFEYTPLHTSEFNTSVDEWSIFLRGWGIEPQEHLILDEMRDQGINARKHMSALNNIYNRDEIAGLFQKWARTDSDFCDWRWMLEKRYETDDGKSE